MFGLKALLIKLFAAIVLGYLGKLRKKQVGSRVHFIAFVTYVFVPWNN